MCKKLMWMIAGKWFPVWQSASKPDNAPWRSHDADPAAAEHGSEFATFPNAPKPESHTLNALSVSAAELDAGVPQPAAHPPAAVRGRAVRSRRLGHLAGRLSARQHLLRHLQRRAQPRAAGHPGSAATRCGHYCAYFERFIVLRPCCWTPESQSEEPRNHGFHFCTSRYWVCLFITWIRSYFFSLM